ncbi:uncharacterized protein LOC125224952 [Leguminivora glycinivorella]|uniref:uncharacterized protein LOC125224952 n=1 Tax=Leguminivora glycinivorella TaxID=1035111 RepID=UPI00200EB515|nr:uncharacterized protein LOC125224952 [Leguminivora glycinivorella]
MAVNDKFLMSRADSGELICQACQDEFKVGEEYLQCRVEMCRKLYHHGCSGKTIMLEERDNWVCPECCIKYKQVGRNCETPVGTPTTMKNVMVRNRSDVSFSTQSSGADGTQMMNELQQLRVQIGQLKGELANAVSTITRYQAVIEDCAAKFEATNERLMNLELASGCPCHHNTASTPVQVSEVEEIREASSEAGEGTPVELAVPGVKVTLANNNEATRELTADRDEEPLGDWEVQRKKRRSASSWRNNLMSSDEINLVAVTESNLDESVYDAEVCGAGSDWNMLRRDRIGRGGGGVLLISRAPLCLERLTSYETDQGEDLWYNTVTNVNGRMLDVVLASKEVRGALRVRQADSHEVLSKIDGHHPPIIVQAQYVLAVTNTAYRRLGFVLRNSAPLTVEATRVLYAALVRSILETNAVVWSPHESKYILMLEQVQKATLARGAIRCWRRAPRAHGRTRRRRSRAHALLNSVLEAYPECDLFASAIGRLMIECKKMIEREMPNRKAVGADGVPIEAWKAMGPRGVGTLTDLFNRALFTSEIPDQWRLSIITPVFKGKGSVQECCNYRGIKVMSHTMKLLERIVDSRIRQECSVSECQYGFRPGLGTMDPIFALRIVMEKYRRKKTPLHFLFLDMEKAFDCVPREMIWWAMRAKGVPEIYVGMIRDMYRDSESMVRTAVGDTKPFPISVGVHQGSVLSPFLFSAILDEVSNSIRNTHEQPPWLLMYADDIALADADRGRLVRRATTWKESLENGGLKLNVAKTEYMACNIKDPAPVRIGDKVVDCTDQFKYLGSVLHASGDIDNDIKTRITAAWAKWREVTGVICDPKMPVKLKGQVYKSIIRPVLLYGSEAWPVLERHKQLLRVTEMNMLRWMCGVSRRDRVRNSRIRGSLHVRDIADKLQESRLRWYGHVLRKPASYIGNKCLAMAPPPGPGRRGAPKKCWLDVVGVDMRVNGLTKRDAEDRAKWRRKSRKADPGLRSARAEDATGKPSR